MGKIYQVVLAVLKNRKEESSKWDKAKTATQGFDEEREAIVTGRLAGAEASEQARQALNLLPAIRGRHKFEQQRLRNIARNQELLAKLGLA